ncbi:hypothetical protein FHS27_003713 [Rhodopirellula rubra]|uniref:Uncharacterized protein n=1 Tax=Aporhodopirellula rubra TaxID=980271 RepID=A0A7W5E0G2_9BACT|nr:hypothetical protein [Aporhodopirellula rubra]
MTTRGPDPFLARIALKIFSSDLDREANEDSTIDPVQNRLTTRRFHEPRVPLLTKATTPAKTTSATRINTHQERLTASRPIFSATTTPSHLTRNDSHARSIGYPAPTNLSNATTSMRI